MRQFSRYTLAFLIVGALGGWLYLGTKAISDAEAQSRPRTGPNSPVSGNSFTATAGSGLVGLSVPTGACLALEGTAGGAPCAGKYVDVSGNEIRIRAGGTTLLSTNSSTGNAVANNEVHSGGGVFYANGTNTGAILKGHKNDGAANVGVILDNDVTLSTAGAKLLSVRNNGSERMSLDKDGVLTVNSYYQGPGSGQARLDSTAADSLTSASVGAIRLNQTVDITDGDLILAVTNAVPANVFTVNEQGSLTIPDLQSLSGAGGGSVTFSSSQGATLNWSGKSILVDSNGVRIPELNGSATTGTGYSVVERASLQTFVHKTTVTEAALTDADGSEDETIWTMDAKTKVQRVVADVTATFTGGGITDLDVVCGTTAGGNEYLVSFDIDTATGTYGDAEAELGASLAGGIGHLAWAAGQTVQCRFTCAGASCSAATAGSMTFYIEGTVYP